MGFKKVRIGTRLVAAARAGDRYRDVHVFFGGTGAVGGTAVLQMLSLYEEMMAIRPAGDDEVPVLVATGRTREEIEVFTQRLFRYVQVLHGNGNAAGQRRGGDTSGPLTRVRDGYLTASGVFIALQRFQVTALPGLDRIQVTPPDERKELVAAYLESIGTSIDAPADQVAQALRRAIRATGPFTSFLSAYRERHFADRPGFRFRSVHLGIPLPSLMAYHLQDLELATREIPGFASDITEMLKDEFVTAIRDDVARIQEAWADHVLVAHTTSVGGMYDEFPEEGGTRRKIRLGFAHSALDSRLVEKQKFAERLTDLYASAGIRMLITAAAIGVDEVKVGTEVPVHRYVGQMLYDAPVEVFPGSKATQPADSRASREAGRPVPVRQVVRSFRPLTVPLDDPPGGPARFDRGEEIRPSFVLRSGENGFFTVANAEALYRVMRVASASELGLVMAVCGLFGDDPLSPWFVNNVCYYTETDNSRQVLDFLAQPALRQAQLNGLDPMALQDLGSAKHQCELHTLGLLILLHRLRTLDCDAIPPYVDLDRFDPRAFFLSHSRVLTFEDFVGWDLERLWRDLTLLAAAEEPEDLEWLTPFRARMHEDLYPRRQEARRRVLETALKAVWQIPSLGTPILFERDGRAMLRTGYYVAPLDLLVTEKDAVARRLREAHRASGNPCSYETYRDFHVCVGGFLDLRPHAILSTASNDREDLTGKVKRFDSVIALRQALHEVEPYHFFTMCGFLAIVYRMQALYALLREAVLELGTLQDFRWQMPRDEHGHILVVPGIVEALRMVAEGLEKNTGTERLDGLWGYERREVPDRRARVLPCPGGR